MNYTVKFFTRDPRLSQVNFVAHLLDLDGRGLLCNTANLIDCDHGSSFRKMGKLKMNQIRGLSLTASSGLAVALLLTGTVGCASLRESGKTADNAAFSEGDSANEQPHVDVRAIYLSAGDEIRIAVHGRPELTRQVVIPPDGRLFYPFLGDINVAGRSVTDLRELIAEGLAGEASRVLSAGDEISIQVFRRQELGTQAIISQDGMIPLPLIGDVQVIGLSPSLVSERVAAELRRYMHAPQVMTRVVRYGGSLPVSSPQVAIDLIRLTGERFFVLGEVRMPGVYPMVGQVTILEAVAAAGGFLREAKTGSVLLMRAGGPGRAVEVSEVALDKFERDGSGAGIVLGRGDVVYVPEKTISQVARFSRTISEIIRPIIDIETGIWLWQNIDEGPPSRSRDTTRQTIVVDR